MSSTHQYILKKLKFMNYSHVPNRSSAQFQPDTYETDVDVGSQRDIKTLFYNMDGTTSLDCSKQFTL